MYNNINYLNFKIISLHYSVNSWLKKKKKKKKKKRTSINMNNNYIILLKQWFKV